MRFTICIFFLFSLILFFGCKPKYGTHKIVFTDENNKASNDVYISFLTDQIDQYPEEEDNYIKLANIYKGLNNDSKAIELLQKGGRKNPESVAILIELSAHYLKEKNSEKLSGNLLTIGKLAPNNMDFLKLSAGYSLLIKDYENALFFVNRAILANPFDDENQYLRGSAQLINRDSLNALLSFEEAYKLKNSYKNFAGVFDVTLALGDLSKARRYLDEVRTYKTDQELCYEFGAYLNEIGEKDSSKVILFKCLLDKSSEPRIKFELAKIYYNENNIDSTIYFVNQYLNSNPAGTSAHILKAKTLEKINHYTDARNLYLSALEIDSTSILASKGLDNLERKVAYLRLVKRKEDIQRQIEALKPLIIKDIN